MDMRTLQDTKLDKDKSPALTLSGIGRQFGTVRAVDDISLDVRPGKSSVSSDIPVVARPRFCGLSPVSMHLMKVSSLWVVVHWWGQRFC